MKKTILFGLLLISIVFVAGCTQQGEVQYVCGDMELFEARQIALQSDCLLTGTLEETQTCNNVTMTWWIDLNPYEPMEGCNPACVVDIATETAEVNPRCTGLIT